MKKLALAVAMTSALGAYGVANATTVSEFSNGFLVPYVTFNANSDTAIGVTSCAAGNVYWTFFDQDSQHVQDDSFPVTKNDQEGIIWSNVAGAGLQGELGYMVFVLDDRGLSDPPPGSHQIPDGGLSQSDTPCLAGSAFQLYHGSNQAAYIPTPPLSLADFNNGGGVPALNQLSGTTVTGLEAGAQIGDTIYNRYWIDNTPGAPNTSIVLWSAQDLSGQHTVFMYDSAQDETSVTIDLGNKELNILDPETIKGRNPNFTDGFITFTVPQNPSDTKDPGNGVLSFSLLDAGPYGMQTIVNPFTSPDSGHQGHEGGCTDSTHGGSCGS